MDEKFEKVCEIIADELDVNAEDITMETNLVEDLEADSLSIVELVMAFEDEFDVKLRDEELENIKTVGDIIDALNK